MRRVLRVMRTNSIHNSPILKPCRSRAAPGKVCMTRTADHMTMLPVALVPSKQDVKHKRV